MSIFRGEIDHLNIEIDSGARAFLKPRAAAQGITVEEYCSKVIHAHALEASNADRATGGALPYSERGVLLALFLKGLDDSIYRGIPWVTRAGLVQQLGLTKVAIGLAVESLRERGLIRERFAVPSKGRHGPIPKEYTLTAQGVQAAFLLEAPTEASMQAAGAWEDQIGTPESPKAGI